MNFNEKLQLLRRKKGITQEELARALFVSRTAVSKWESGRGYPEIESLKALASFFGVTVDELLSTDEVLTIAQEENAQRQKNIFRTVFGLVDLSMALLFFIPCFSARSNGEAHAATLGSLDGAQPYLWWSYFSLVILTVITGALTLALQGCAVRAWRRIESSVSIILGAASVLLFTVSLQPYAAAFAFVLLSIKAVLLIKRH